MLGPSFTAGEFMHCLVRRIVSVLFVLCLLLCVDVTAVAQGTADVETLKKRADLYRSHIQKQQRNIKRMQEELAVHPDNPNVKILGDFFATTSGVRTQAFKNEPPEIQSLIDTLEKDKALIAMNSVTMTEWSARGNVAKGHFLVEIDRSRKFLAMLRRQLKDTQAKIDSQSATGSTNPTTTVKLPDAAHIIGRWKYVNGVYQLEISGNDGKITGTIKESTPPEAKFPWDYKVGTTMFENGKLQPDGSIKVDWAQYTWQTSSLNKVLGRGSTPAVIRLRADKEAFVATGRNRMFVDSPATHERWLNEFGKEFKFSFIKIH